MSAHQICTMCRQLDRLECLFQAARLVSAFSHQLCWLSVRCLVCLRMSLSSPYPLLHTWRGRILKNLVSFRGFLRRLSLLFEVKELLCRIDCFTPCPYPLGHPAPWASFQGRKFYTGGICYMTPSFLTQMAILGSTIWHCLGTSFGLPLAVLFYQNILVLVILLSLKHVGPEYCGVPPFRMYLMFFSRWTWILFWGDNITFSSLLILFVTVLALASPALCCIVLLGMASQCTSHLQNKVFFFFNSWKAETLHISWQNIFYWRTDFSVHLFLFTWTKRNGWGGLSGTGQNVCFIQRFCATFSGTFIYPKGKQGWVFLKSWIYFPLYLYISFSSHFYNNIQFYVGSHWVVFFFILRKWNYGL